MGDEIGGDPSLDDKSVEGEEISVARLTEEGSEDSVASEDGGAAIGVNGVASKERRFVKIILSDEGENTVVEVEAIAGENVHLFGEFGSVRVSVLGGRRALLLLLMRTDGGKGGFNAEAAFATTALGGGFFRCGEGE